MWRILPRLPRRPCRCTLVQGVPARRNYVDARFTGTLGNYDTLVPSDAQRKTIYALSTPPGKGGVAVIRVSGPEALSVWRTMVVPTRKSMNGLPTPWKMERCQVVKPDNTGEQLDDGLAVYFQGPKSFTTEDVVELHIHSGRAVISSVLGALSTFPYCRPAEPGEFTRRGFEAGRLDLTQVEGLHDLINADTEGQRRIALNAASGHSRAKLEHLRSGIIKVLAKVEALIDFGEAEDIEDHIYRVAREDAQDLLREIRLLLDDRNRGEIIRSGVRLAIFGPPNAGKSSLLNYLAQREAAIVTPVPGTTRDILELSLDIGGLPVIVSDTAGLRTTEDVVESIGIERAKKAVENSDVSICVLSLADLTSSHEEPIKIPESVKELVSSNTVILLNKSDLSDPVRTKRVIDQLDSHRVWPVSIKLDEGTDRFLAGFAELLQERFHLDGKTATQEAPVITRARHRTHLESACRFLEAFLQTSPSDVVFAAEELRYAAQAVGRVSGHIDIEDVLDSVFRDFCIGK